MIHPRGVVSDADRPPALRVYQDDFEEAPGEYAALNRGRRQIREALRGVGRIHHGSVTLGTAFLAGENVVLTNRHVAEAFTTDVDGVLKIRAGWSPAIDFAGDHEPPPPSTQGGTPPTHHEPGSSADHGGGDETPATTSLTSHMPSRAQGRTLADARRRRMLDTTDHSAYHAAPSACYRITSVIYADPELDLAVLRIELDPKSDALVTPPAWWTQPVPLKLATTPPRAERVPVCVIGFPDYDDTASPSELSTVFQDVFDVKRVQPGYLTRLVMHREDRVEIGHDCSTLRGNSGSCVIDLNRHEVIGIHVRGSREGPGQVAFNQAIGLWHLPAATREMLEAAGVTLGASKPPEIHTNAAEVAEAAV